VFAVPPDDGQLWPKREETNPLLTPIKLLTLHEPLQLARIYMFQFDFDVGISVCLNMLGEARANTFLFISGDCLSIYLSIYLFYLSVRLSVHLPTYLPMALQPLWTLAAFSVS
jgi:hypothetical protein